MACFLSLCHNDAPERPFRLIDVMYLIVSIIIIGSSWRFVALNQNWIRFRDLSGLDARIGAFEK